MRELRALSSRLCSPWLLALCFAALVPTAAEALPRHCDVVCRCSGSCNWKCNASDGGIAIVTCGQWGICSGQCRAEAKDELVAFEQDAPGQPAPAQECTAAPGEAPASPLELVAE